MVKTRSASQPPPSNPPQKQQKAKKRRPAAQNAKRSTICNHHIREKIRAKISKASREKLQRREKVIDFGKEEFVAFTGPQKFHCPICLQIMIFPAISECGHTFCLPCLEESLKHKRACSLCREPLSFEQFKESLLIKDILGKVIERSLSSEEMEQYRERIKAFETKDSEERVSDDAAVGDNVDFYVDGAWHEGTVTEKEENEENQIILTIESTQNEELSRQLGLSSRLLAKHHVYTKEKEQSPSFIGQFRLSFTSHSFREINLVPDSSMQVGTNQIELYPISLHAAPFELGGDGIRITFTFAEQN